MALHPGLFKISFVIYSMWDEKNSEQVEIVIICIEYYEKEMEGEG
jgi:hypothetical protein